MDDNRNFIIPDSYSKVILIPWAVGIIDDFPFDEYPADKSTIENINKQHQIERQFELFLNNDTEAKYRISSLKELARRFQIEYSIETDSLIKQTPGVTRLLSQTKKNLNHLLHLLAKEKKLNLYIQDNDRYKAAMSDWSLATENTIFEFKDYILFQEKTSWDSTSYLFPEDRMWCLGSIEDYQNFILYCNDDVLSGLAELDGLEYFETTRNSLFNTVYA